MYKRIVTGLAFFAYMALGNVCMTSMVHAEEMPMPPESYEMTEGIAPMSTMELHEQMQEPSPEHQTSPCGNGHCLSASASEHITDNPALNGVPVAPSRSVPACNSPIPKEYSGPIVHTPLNRFIATQAVVLRL